MAIDLGAQWTDADTTVLTCSVLQSDGSALDPVLFSYNTGTEILEDGSGGVIGAAYADTEYTLKVTCEDEYTAVTGIFSVVVNDEIQVDQGMSDTTILTNEATTVALPADVFSDSDAFTVAVDT